MSILTKEEREEWRLYINKRNQRKKHSTFDFGSDFRFTPKDIECALDTIDALEEELEFALNASKFEDAFRIDDLTDSLIDAEARIAELEAELLHADALFENANRDLAWRRGMSRAMHLWLRSANRRADSAKYATKQVESTLEAIHTYALEHSTTRVIGGAHAALKVIAKMAGGGE